MQALSNSQTLTDPRGTIRDGSDTLFFKILKTVCRLISKAMASNLFRAAGSNLEKSFGFECDITLRVSLATHTRLPLLDSHDCCLAHCFKQQVSTPLFNCPPAPQITSLYNLYHIDAA